jgi:hypothetical protein
MSLKRISQLLKSHRLQLLSLNLLSRFSRSQLNLNSSQRRSRLLPLRLSQLHSPRNKLIRRSLLPLLKLNQMKMRMRSPMMLMIFLLTIAMMMTMTKRR